MDTVGSIVIFGACIWVLWWMLHGDQRKFRKLEAEVCARQPISDQEFESQYFRCVQVPIDVAIRIRRVFAKFTGLPIQNILPDDDLRPYVLDNEDEVLDAIEKEFALTISNSHSVKILTTVRSVSMVIAEQMRAAGRNAGRLAQ